MKDIIYRLTVSTSRVWLIQRKQWYRYLSRHYINYGTDFKSTSAGEENSFEQLLKHHIMVGTTNGYFKQYIVRWSDVHIRCELNCYGCAFVAGSYICKNILNNADNFVGRLLNIRGKFVRSLWVGAAVSQINSLAGSNFDGEIFQYTQSGGVRKRTNFPYRT